MTAPRPIDMVLHCPKCGQQHIDKPDPPRYERISYPTGFTEVTVHDESENLAWTNPPHRSHLCAACGCVWRPADVPTNGVADTYTHGPNDLRMPWSREDD